MDDSVEDPAVGLVKIEAGKQLRRCLLERFCLDGMPASTVAVISYWCSKAGAVGVEDLAMAPDQATKHASEHIKTVAGKIYPEPNLHQVSSPMCIKREARRAKQEIPVYMPSQAFKDHVEATAGQTETNMPRLIGNISSYWNHPVVVKAMQENNQTMVRPIALCWDGVQYTKRDSFMGFYVTDILSNKKFLSFLVRTLQNSF